MKFIAISAAKHPDKVSTNESQTSNSLQHCPFTPDSSCAHQFLLDGYFLFGVEENPLTAFNSALLRDYLFLFYFSR